MTEEFVTLTVLELLRGQNYEIVTFNFPQGGGGLLLHPSNRVGKSTNSIVPDILAKRGNTAIFLENKVRFLRADAAKLRLVRDTDLYDEHLRRIGIDRAMCSIKFGVALADLPSNSKAFFNHASDLDLFFLVSAGGVVNIAQGAI